MRDRKKRVAPAAKPFGRLYYGRERNHGTPKVWRRIGTQDGPLAARPDLWDYGDAPLDWGYGGSAVHALALALLADALGDDQKALELHAVLVWECLWALPDEGWQVTQQDLTQWAVAHDRELADVVEAERRAHEDDSGVDLSTAHLSNYPEGTR